MEGFSLKSGMKLGVATAATQIEGGDRNNSWFDWSLKGKILDKSSPLRANDHYVRYREDTALLKKMGIQIYRFGVEWSRIEPEPGVFDENVLFHYKQELTLLKEMGIEPLVTLHHFTNPVWFEKLGGFENSDSVKIFLRFVKKVVSYFGDYANEYITINEPNVYAVNGYYFGIWPPGKKSFRSVMKVYGNLTTCHIEAYKIIHRLRKDMEFSGTKVGFAHHMRVFKPENNKNFIHKILTYVLELLFQKSIAQAFMTGKCIFPVKKIKSLKQGNYYDFIGLNYYSRSTVSNFGDGVGKNVPVNDLGWEIYPKGILQCAEKLYKKQPAPIYITENGTCDNNDSFRSRYIYEHLKELCESDLPIQKYYH